MRLINATKVLTSLAAALLAGQTTAGPVGYGICQAGCSTLVVACYGAAGATFGTVVAAAAAPPAILACNAAFGACSANCAVVALTPLP
jgi:hypothetical protein